MLTPPLDIRINRVGNESRQHIAWLDCIYSELLRKLMSQIDSHLV